MWTTVDKWDGEQFNPGDRFTCLGRPVVVVEAGPDSEGEVLIEDFSGQRLYAYAWTLTAREGA